VTNTIALVLGFLIVGAIAADVIFYGSENLLFVLRKMFDHVSRMRSMAGHRRFKFKAGRSSALRRRSHHHFRKIVSVLNSLGPSVDSDVYLPKF